MLHGESCHCGQNNRWAEMPMVMIVLRMTKSMMTTMRRHMVFRYCFFFCASLRNPYVPAMRPQYSRVLMQPCRQYSGSTSTATGPSRPSLLTGYRADSADSSSSGLIQPVVLGCRAHCSRGTVHRSTRYGPRMPIAKSPYGF